MDTDIIFWDGGFKFFTGWSGCSGGIYIEDVAAHEFGHALGLNHTSMTGATMSPTTGYCSQNWRTLAADDVAGVEALYPGGTPIVSSRFPGHSSDGYDFEPCRGGVVHERHIHLLRRVCQRSAGWKLDRRPELDFERGRTDWDRWQLQSSESSGSGTHVISAGVIDSGGLSDSSQVTVTVTERTGSSPSPTPTADSDSDGQWLQVEGVSGRKSGPDVDWLQHGHCRYLSQRHTLADDPQRRVTQTITGLRKGS